jgi:hypothetical protein
MSVRGLTVDEICDMIRALRQDELDRVLRFLHALEQARKLDNSTADEPVAPLYSAHTAAVRTGIPDLADQHDHYLYGLDKRDARDSILGYLYLRGVGLHGRRPA